MPNYRRDRTPGATYFFTVVTYQRRPWLCHPSARRVLREAVRKVQASRPFRIDAWVLLPDHLHCIWTLPEGDCDYSVRWRLIKDHASRCLSAVLVPEGVRLSESRRRRGETAVWQRRFWEHRIRNGADFIAYCDYIHYNPVKHGLCRCPTDWPWSTIHRLVSAGYYPPDWGSAESPRGEPAAVGE